MDGLKESAVWVDLIYELINSWVGGWVDKQIR